jgi:hypothetical protein
LFGQPDIVHDYLNRAAAAAGVVWPLGEEWDDDVPYLEGKEMDRLTNGRWFSVHAEPGKHQLQSSAKNEPATVIETVTGGNGIRADGDFDRELAWRWKIFAGRQERRKK